METLSEFEAVMQLTHEALRRREHCSHVARDGIAGVEFCRSCLQVLFDGDLDDSEAIRRITLPKK